MDPNLLNFIKENLARGIPQDQIRQTLLGAGWKSEDIDSAFNQLQSPLSATVAAVPHKSPFNIKFLLLGILAAILLASAAGGAYLFITKKNSPTGTSSDRSNPTQTTQQDQQSQQPSQASPQTQTAPAQTSDSSNKYAACFSKYDEKFMPNSLSNYGGVMGNDGKPIIVRYPVPVDNFSIVGVDHVKANWGITGTYVQSGYPQSGGSLIFSVGDVLDPPNYFLPGVQTELIEGLQVIVGSSEEGSSIQTIVPNTNVVIVFVFKPQEPNAKAIFANWLKLVCG